ncbi:ECF RNA polymerase sigma factor SigW [Phycisphaerae bacterium RAS2]|nr:ECF RNA polymerase sigma factor SigW [Phycisphaerae bacterium RAS2]
MLVRCRSGDATAFGVLVRAYQDRILNVCWRLCGRREDAEDLAQEAFVRAFQQIHRFEGKSQFYTWVYRIAVNLALTARRRPTIARTASLDGGRDGHRENRDRDGRGRSIASTDRAPIDAAAANESQELIAAALEKLEADHRAVVVLRDLDGLDYDEIAEILDIPRGTVKSRLHRGRAALRDLLAGRSG